MKDRNNLSLHYYLIKVHNFKTHWKVILKLFLVFWQRLKVETVSKENDPDGLDGFYTFLGSKCKAAGVLIAALIIPTFCYPLEHIRAPANRTMVEKLVGGRLAEGSGLFFIRIIRSGDPRF